MPNPFVENEDDIRDEVNKEAAIEEQASQTLEVDADGAIDVAFDAPEELKPSRDEKKRNRYREEQEGRLKAETENEMLKQELQRLRAQPAPQYVAPPQPQVDPTQQELDSVYDRQQELQNSFMLEQQAGTLTPEKSTEMMSKARKLDERKLELIAQRTNRQSGVGQQDPNAGMRQMLQSRYFDVMQNETAKKWAMGRLQQRLAEGANNSDLSLMDDIAEETRSRFKIGRYRNGNPPSEATKNRHTGAPTGMASTTQERPRSIKMTPQYRSMANAYAPHIKDDAARYKHWANGPGKALMEEESRRER
jgi:hypothetical protein